MFCPNLRQVLRQFQTVTTSKGRSTTMSAPQRDTDATLRTSEEPATDAEAQLLGLAAQAENQKKLSRRRFM